MVIPQPNEIRVIRMKREAILNYVYSYMMKNYRSLFKLPADEESSNYVLHDVHYDIEMHDFIFYVCNKEHEVDEKELTKIIRNEIPLVYRESIENRDWQPTPYSIIFSRAKNNEEKRGTTYNKAHGSNTVTVFDTKCKRESQKNELRAIRFSEHEIFYLMWYYWIDVQEEYMGVEGIQDMDTADEIDKKYNFSPIFPSCPINWIEEVMFFLVNEKEFWHMNFDVVEEYCRNHIPFCDEEVLQKPSDSYYSVVNWMKIEAAKKQE